MAAISFKDVGEKLEDVERRRALDNVEQLPLGIVTPVRAGDEAEGIFKMHRSLRDQVRDNLKNLLLTNRGDRVVTYDFGADLQPLTFELTSRESFDSEAMLRIKRAVAKFMPFVVLVDFESNIRVPSEPLSTGRVEVRVTYDVPAAGLKGEGIAVVFYVGG